jgi:aminopeptidase N
MLRNYVGDDAFYKSLNNYLTTNKFKTGEAGQLRLAFEEVTGKDMNWFWDQWYYGNGHPKLKISYNYDVPGIAKVYVEQTQKTGPIFKLPIAVDIYNGTTKQRQNIWVQNRVDSFSFAYTVKPDLINVDADKTLLAEKTDNKSEENFLAQWKYAKNYLDRREALDFFAKKSMPEIAKGLNDKFAGLRQYTIQTIAATPYKSDAVVLESIENIAKTDRDKKTKAAAISFLVKNGNAKYLPIFQQMVNDSSYTVAGAALKGLVALDAANAYTIAKKYSGDAKGALGNAILDILFVQGTEADFDIISKAYKSAPASQEKIMMTNKFGNYLLKVNDMAKLKSGVNDIIDFRNSIPAQYRSYMDPSFKASFDKIAKAKGKEMETYINSVFN